MSVLARNRSARERPPQLHVPFGLSFHDSFFGYGKYDLLNETAETPLGQHESSEPYRRDVYLSESTLRIPRKPVGSRSPRSLSQQYPSPTPTPISATSPSKPLLPKPRLSTTADIYWLIPVAAVLCFVAGVSLAIGHYGYLRSLHEEDAENQVWVGRYSLAMAFLVKAFLSAAISIAFTQRVWHSLQRVKRGMSMYGIDALFSADQAPLSLVSWELWRHAFVPALMAVSIWLMPLIQVLAPTALTVGSSQNISEDTHCLVPTLNITHLPETDRTSLSLFDVDYSQQRVNPSITARYLVDLTAQGGRQVGWNSPCGSNCTYNVDFIAPAWTCDRTDRADRSSGYWPSKWFPGYGDGSNYSASGLDVSLEYSPIYQANYNSGTGQFWVGATDSVALDHIPADLSVKDFLDLHLYVCNIAWAAYRLRVTYINHQQINDVAELIYQDRIDIPQSVWEGRLDGHVAKDAATVGVASLYSPLLDILTGYIDRDPKVSLTPNTSIGSVPTLVKMYTGTWGRESGQEDPYMPVLAIGPQLEKLSQNISISLLSQPKLDTTTTTETTCTTYTTITVWKFMPAPLVIAYTCAVCAATAALVLGGQALLAAGVTRDRSFSSIVRSTRHRDLDALCARDEGTAALPLSPELRRRRFRFSLDGTAHGIHDTSEKRMSFRPVEEHGGGGIGEKMEQAVLEAK